MRVHVVGAGPTGMSLAWEIARNTAHDVIVYDKKPSAGGSWWEPTEGQRDLHSHRIVFDGAYVNTKSLFSEMGVDWHEMFQKSEGSFNKAVLSRLKPRDYLALGSLSVRVLSQPEKYKKIVLKDAVGALSPGGEEVLSNFPLIMDGVDWTRMTAYEFVKSFDYVALSTQYTQKVSGKVMCDRMQKALEREGVEFKFNTELEHVDYTDDGFTAKFSGMSPVCNDGFLVLCVDHTPARSLVKNNWGKVTKNLVTSTYGALNVLLDYDHPVAPMDMYEATMGTPWKIIPAVLSDGKTVSCVIPKITREIETTPPERIFEEVISQLKLPKPYNARVAWGCDWNGKEWSFSQSSGVLSPLGQIPFWGKSPKVALCGMMSPHVTPFASIETAVEVSRRFSHETFGTRPALVPLLLTHVLFYLLLIVFILVLKRKQ